ncbi:MAG: class I SAM-dependent methyltransferase [Caldilinea sp. CFX5]|nr:class I SAM-dependent methyltransferase [Caldilinea sp. CFX5]
MGVTASGQRLSRNEKRRIVLSIDWQGWLLRYLEACFHETVRGVYSSPNYLLEPNPNAVLLDCGCNNGLYSLQLGQQLGTRRIYGLEYNYTLAQEAAQAGVQALCSDLNRAIPLPSESVTVVTAFNVLEHLIETQCFLQEIYRVLTPGGYAIINTPNLASWHNIAALLMGLQPFSGPNIDSMTESDVPIVRRMHRRAYQLPEEPETLTLPEPERHRHLVVVAFRSIQKALVRTGFVIEDALGFGYYPLPPALAKIMSQLDPAHAHHMVLKVRKPLQSG